MKTRILKRLTTALLAFALVATPLLFATDVRGQGVTPNRFWVGVVDERGESITSGLSCQVYTAGTDTPSVISSDQNSTALANPFAANSLGECSWFSSATTAVDLVVYQSGRGAKSRLNSVTVNDHRTVMDRQTITKVLRSAWSTGTSNGGKVVTTVTIPKGAVVHDVLIEVTLASGAAHLALGINQGETGGNDRGFCSGGTTKVGDQVWGKSVERLGWHRCHAVLATATPTWLDYRITAFHSGSLVSRGAVGSDTAAVAHAGSYMRQPYVGDGTAKTVVYATTADAVGAAAGHFYILLYELATGP